MRTRNVMVAVLLLGLLLIPLQVFASGQKEGEGKVELTWMQVFGDKEIWQQIIDQYNESNPNVTVTQKVVTGGASTYQEVLKTGLASGTGPEVFFEWGGSLSGVIIEAGHALPLNSYYDQYGWEDQLIGWGLDKLKANSEAWGKPGEIYGVLWSTMGMTFWYNKELWNELDLSVPENYEEMEALNRKIKRQGKTPISIGGRYGWMTMRIFDYLLEVTAGPELHDQLAAMEANWDRPEVVRAFELFQKWVDEGWIIEGFLNTTPTNSHQPWYQGQAVMTLEGNWMPGTIKAEGADPTNFDFFIHPTGYSPTRVSGFIEQMMISANKSKAKQDAAAHFIDWFIQPEQQAWRLGNVHTATGTKNVPVDEEEQPLVAKSVETLANLKATWLVLDQQLPEEVLHKYFEVQDRVAAGGLSPQKAAQEVQKAVEAYKAEQ